MLLSAPLAAGEPRLPPPFPPLFAPPLGCLMSGARDALKPPPPSVAAAAAAESAAAALYPSYHHAGVAAASQLLHLHGYPASSHAVYPGFGYPVYPSAGARPPLAAPPAEQRSSGLYPLSFRPAVSGKEQLVAPPSSARAAPPSFAPDELRGFGATAKDGVLRVPAQYPSHVAGVLPPPPPAATGDGSRAAYPAAGTPPRSAAPAQAGRFPFGARRAPSSEDPPPPRQRMLTADPPSEQPPPAKRARLEPSRERPPLSAAAAAAAAGRVKSEMPSAVSSDHYVPPEHFRSGAIIELADGRLKPVEELRTEDFESSAEQCAELRLDRSVVTRIDELGRTAQIVFAVGPSRTEVTVEAQLEHPFFVFHRGWSSCSPRRTLQQYSLSCHQLSVGDACVSLAPRSPPLQTTQTQSHQSHQQPGQQQSHQQPGQQQSHQQQQQAQQGNHTARGAT